MEFELSRLRHGEIVAGVSGALLIVALFAVPWFGTTGPISPTAALLGATTSSDGWHALSDLRWLMLVTALLALALVYLQATRRAPALPASVSVIVTVLGLLTLLCLIYRVLINVPGPDSLIDRKPGSYIALVCAIGILYGGCASLREEGIRPQDGPGEVPTVSLRDAG